jgi:hypothetical protein
MKIISWNEWLNEYIPYYEGERHRDRFSDNPPGEPWETWDDLNRRLQDCGYRCSPMFLERDTRQEWYWAFWNNHDALLCMLKMS